MPFRRHIPILRMQLLFPLYNNYSMEVYAFCLLIYYLLIICCQLTIKTPLVTLKINLFRRSVDQRTEFVRKNLSAYHRLLHQSTCHLVLLTRRNRLQLYRHQSRCERSLSKDGRNYRQNGEH